MAEAVSPSLPHNSMALAPDLQHWLVQSWMLIEALTYYTYCHKEIYSGITWTGSEASFCLQKAWFIYIFQTVLNFGDTGIRDINQWYLIFTALLSQERLPFKNRSKPKQGIDFLLILCNKCAPCHIYKFHFVLCKIKPVLPIEYIELMIISAMIDNSKQPALIMYFTSELSPY